MMERFCLTHFRNINCFELKKAENGNDQKHNSVQRCKALTCINLKLLKPNLILFLRKMSFH